MLKELFASRYFFLLSLAAIIILALFLRIHNIFSYNSYWADDGGAHIAYLETIRHDGRLPTLEENYLAWHEPLYYLLTALWVAVGAVFGITSLNWSEALQILFFFIAAFAVEGIAYRHSKGNKIVTVFSVMAFSFFFTAVKLSAYLTNELLAQALILSAVLPFLYGRLGEKSPPEYAGKSRKNLIAFSIILGIATLVKLTAFVALGAAVLTWLIAFARTREQSFLFSAAVALAIVGIINLPWVVYKYHHFDSVFTINLAESGTKQSIVSSDGWQYLRTLNAHVFSDYPYWFRGPHSFVSILIADAFGDYYNLFGQADRVRALPDTEKILTGNGRYTTPANWRANAWAIRTGLVISLVSVIGFIGFIVSRFRSRSWTANDIFLTLLVLGGFLSLVYNVLRLPYLERGTLKAQFILFAFPLLWIISNTWWSRVVKRPAILSLIIGAPWIVYLFLAWPILWVS